MNLKAVCFGEVLWDIFPESKKIGGAPLNVALRLQSFGINTAIISKVGNDTRGAIITDYIQENKVSADFIQKDPKHKTGEVTVMLDKNGTATYNINYPTAWDKIEFTPSSEKLVSDADAFIFGSLACRDRVSKASLFKLLKFSKFNVLDVNLRAPYYNEKVLIELMNLSDFIKFNDEEIIKISTFIGLKQSPLEKCIKHISKQTNTNSICVTLGAKGAVLYMNNTFYYNIGFIVKVADTVGAGDSFLAGLIYKLLNSEHPQESLDFACAIGSIVAGKDGANPEIGEGEINKTLSR